MKAKDKARTWSCHLSLEPDSYCPELFLSSSIEVFAPILAETWWNHSDNVCQKSHAGTSVP